MVPAPCESGPQIVLIGGQASSPAILIRAQQFWLRGLRERQVMVQVAGMDQINIVGFGQTLGRELADGLQHPVATTTPRDVLNHEL